LNFLRLGRTGEPRVRGGLWCPRHAPIRRHSSLQGLPRGTHGTEALASDVSTIERKETEIGLDTLGPERGDVFGERRETHCSAVPVARLENQELLWTAPGGEVIQPDGAHGSVLAVRNAPEFHIQAWNKSSVQTQWARLGTDQDSCRESPSIVLNVLNLQADTRRNLCLGTLLH
jgi:hypothetical protein